MYKIAVDLTNFSPGKAVGFNEYCLSLLRGFSLINDPGFSLTLYVNHSLVSEFRSIYPGCIIYELPFNHKFYSAFFHHFCFLFLQFRYQKILFPANFLPLFCPRNCVLVVHDLNYLINKSSFTWLMLLYRAVFQKRSIKKALSLIAISSQTYDEILSFSGRPSVVIHNPVRIKVSSTSLTGNFILCATSLAQYKNVVEAYDACALFLDSYPYSDLSFIFIGNWRVEDFPSYKSYPQIKLLGYVTHAVHHDLFSRCLAVLSPSLYEGFGMPYLQALLCSKPLVCCDIPIAREVVGSYPYFIHKPFGSKEILSALICLYNAEFSSRPFDAQYVKRVDPEYVAQRYLSILYS